MADTLADRLIACGPFNFMVNESDTVRSPQIAMWNGARWDSLAHRLVDSESTSVGQSYWAIRFQGDLYLCGSELVVDHPNGQPHLGYAKLNTTEQRWEPFGCHNPPVSSMVFLTPVESIDQDYLYITGIPWPLCNTSPCAIYRWNGTTMTAWPPWFQIPNLENDVINYVFEYREKVYVCGIVSSPWGNGVRNILRHNGTSWEEVPGYNGGLIGDISIYRDTLYVAGQFREATGGPGNGVAAFDGEQWYPLGEGLLFEPSPSLSSGHSLRWFHDELYVGGGFSTAGGIPANGFAKWDRHQWCSLPGFDGDSFANPRIVKSMAVWRDSLYIQGTFGPGLEGQPIRHVAQWIGGDAITDCSDPVGIAEADPMNEIAVTPIPVADSFTLHGIPAHASRMHLFDGLGRQWLNEEVGSAPFDVSSLPSGLYLVVVTDRFGLPLARAPLVKH